MDIKGAILNKSNAILVVLVLFIVACIVYFYLQGRNDVLSETFLREQEAAILFVIYNDDEIIVSSALLYNSNTKRGALFDIPANTGIIFSEVGRVDRIDSVFNPHNPTAYLNAVSRLLGLSTPPFYFFLTLEELSLWVDFIGGVELFIGTPIFERTTSGIISLPSGSVLLDGNTARQFLSIQNNSESSSAWTERRHRFMQAFFSKLSSRSLFLANRHTMPVLKANVTTNMNGRAFDVLLNEIAFFDTSSLSRQNIRGNTRNIENQPLLFPYNNGLLVRETVNQVSAMLRSTQTVANEVWSRRIEIQNGTTRNGLAAQARQRFESMGFSVLTIGNAPTNDVIYTVVLDLSGNLDAAYRIAETIGASRVYSIADIYDDEAERSNSLADIQVILGRDFDGQFVRQVGIEGDGIN